MADNQEITIEIESENNDNNKAVSENVHTAADTSVLEIKQQFQPDEIGVEINLDDIDIELDNSIVISSKENSPKENESIKPEHKKEIVTGSKPISSTVLEELFEFDLSDPITEPTSVVDGDPDSQYHDNSIAKIAQSSEISDKNNSESLSLKSDKVEVKEPAQVGNDSPKEESSLPSTQIIEEVLSVGKDVIPTESALTQPEAVVDKVQSDVGLQNKALPPAEEAENISVHESPTKSETVDASSDIKQYTVDKEDEPVESKAQTEELQPADADNNEFNIELGEKLHNLEKSSDRINQIIIEENGLKLEVDTSREHIVLINSEQEYLKHQHTIMDNRTISFFWPSEGSNLDGTRISISTEKEKTFVIDIDKISISLLGALINSPRPIKILHNAKPFISWCIKNGFNPIYIFDLTTAVNLLTDGKAIDTSIKGLINHFSDLKLEGDKIDFQSFVMISKFMHGFRKKLVDAFQALGIIDVLNFERKIIFPLAAAELNGMPYNKSTAPSALQNALDLVESKYGITSKKELSGLGVLSLSRSYLSERKDLLEIKEFIDADTSESIINNFDTKYVQDDRIFSYLECTPGAGITAKDYSFDVEGVYPFISPSDNQCLVEGVFKDLEVRVIAKLLKNSGLFASFKTSTGPYAYFAGPLFDKKPEEAALDEIFKAKMILEIIVRNLGERETLSYAWDICKTSMKEEEIFALKERFKAVHPELIKLINKIERQAQKNKYITTSSGRISVVDQPNKAFFRLVELYMNDIFKRALELLYRELDDYNTNYSPKITLCTVCSRIITLECDKKIMNNAIDMLTRNISRAATKQLHEMPVSVKVYATEQWEA